MKKFINSLRDFRTYTTDITIISADKDNKHPKKGNLILFLGNIPNEDLVTTLNSGVLAYNNFRSIYKPRNYYTTNKRLKRLNMQKEYYRLLPQLGLHNAYDTRLNVGSYMGRNIIVDLTELVSLETSSLTGKNLLAKANGIKLTIEQIVNQVGYENVTLLVGASSKSTSMADGTVFRDNFSLILRLLRRRISFIPDGLVHTLIFQNPERRSLVKISLTEENTQSLFEGKSSSILINRLLRLSNADEGLTPEEEKEEPLPETEEQTPEEEKNSVSKPEETTPGQRPPTDSKDEGEDTLKTPSRE